MPRNFKLTVAYDGTRYSGWQKTPMGATVEETLQSVLEQILQHHVSLQAASRTDSGVHARGQVVNFLTHRSELPPISRLKISINSLLPKDIVILDIEEKEESFHPTIDCTGKEYHYTISTGSIQLPQTRLYAWHYHYDLDILAMRKGAEAFIGEHDFAAFCNFRKNSHYASTVRRGILSSVKLFNK